jgi:hypothetical protein
MAVLSAKFRCLPVVEESDNNDSLQPPSSLTAVMILNPLGGLRYGFFFIMFLSGMMETIVPRLNTLPNCSLL